MTQFNRRSGARILPALLGGLAATFGFLAVAPLPADAAVAKLIHIGRAITVVNDLRGKIGTQPTKRIIVNERLYFEQRIITTSESRGVVEFRDGSILRIGPDAVVSLDRFVFNPFESKSEKVITVLSGAFRYVSGMKMKSSSLEIRTPAATIGIRGSAADWLVHPKLPMFFALGAGRATVRTARGSVAMRAGQSIAVKERNAPPPAPAVIPAPVAAQVLQFIARQAGGGTTLTGKQALPTVEAKADVDANAVSIADQSAQQTKALPTLLKSVFGHLTILPGAGTGGKAPDVPLLVQASNLGMLTKGANVPLTPAQNNFLQQARVAVPNAAAYLKTATANAQKATKQNGDRSTALIVKNTAKLSDNKADAIKLVEAVAKADPDRTGLVAKSAADGAPDMAIFFAGAAVNVNPDKAVDIGRQMAKSLPNLAGAFAAVLIKANPGSAAQIAVGITKSAPDKANDVVQVASNLAPGNVGNIIAAIGDAVPDVNVAALLTGITPAAGGGDPGGGPPVIVGPPGPGRFIVIPSNSKAENPNQTAPSGGSTS